jgi:antibiotic biosynthesis monooxygenase (ABM) superfamily enzyme
MRAKPSHGELLRGRASELCDTARTFPGYLHSNIRVRDASGTQEIIVGASFRHAKDLAVWEHSEQRAGHLQECELLMEGPGRHLSLADLDSGMAGDPPGQLATAPPRWKTALWVWIALFPTSVALNFLVAPHLDGLPLVLRTLITALLTVPIVVWLGVPAAHFLRDLAWRRR